MLPVLTKLCQEPTALAPSDFDEPRRLGVTDEMIEHALHVAFLFNIINRMADALRFEIGPPASFASSAKNLLSKRGYNL